MDLLLSVGGIVIEVHLRVAHQNAAIRQRGQGVDLQHGAVALDEDLVQVCHQSGCFLCLRSDKAHLRGHLLSLRGVDTFNDVHRSLDDGSGVSCSNVLDGGATSLAANHQGTSARSVHKDGKILLVFDGNLLGKQHRVVWLALCSGLLGNKRLAQHLVCHFLDLALWHNVHASLKVVLLEVAQAASAGQDLRLHYDFISRHLVGLGHGFICREGRQILGHAHTKLLKDLLGLVLMQVQESSLHRSSRRWNKAVAHAAAQGWCEG
mmetsp:Transcript_11241/g.14043  ORF Transcript_11241/g.14043 Transcript_11241/m.14043 type:complete len:264 (+) Transcript_11241:573-1364(+)